jgi:hypothetical protein
MVDTPLILVGILKKNLPDFEAFKTAVMSGLELGK